jgi:hypothetical protein
MRAICSLPLALLIGAAAASGQTNPRTGDRPDSSANPNPRLINVCLITEDVRRLVDFYEPVLQRKAAWSGGDYAEFATGGAGELHSPICGSGEEPRRHPGIPGSERG